MGTLLQDLRYALRSLVKAPSFALLTIATLGLAIGVNTAIFSMLNVVLLRPLPIRDPDTIGFIYMVNPEQGVESGPVSAADFVDFRAEARAFTELAAVNRSASFVMTGVEEPVRVVGFEATANTFRLWGVPVVAGRDFAPGEDRPGADRVAILAYNTWQQRFEGDPEVVGRSIRLNGYETTIIGVASREIEFGTLANAELWVPLQIDEAAASRERRNLWVSGRLVPGSSIEQADQQVAAISDRIASQHPESNGSWRGTVFDMHRTLAPAETWALLTLLGVTVALVMLIACSNVATMMMTRGAGRGREIAVRAALGAGRRRILGQLLTESALLSAGAAVLGLALARLCLMGLVWMAGPSSGITNFMQLVTIDRNVLAFTILVAMIAPLVFGLVPALRSSRPDLVEALKEGGRGNTGGALRGRRFLVAAQVALALSLMAVAGLAVRGLAEQRLLDIGFPTERLLTLRLDLPEASYPDEEAWQQYFDAVLSRVEGLPQVQSAALLSERPALAFPETASFRIEGKPEPEPAEMPFAFVTVTNDGGIEAMGIPLQQGRSLEPTDTSETVPVALVNAHAAERYWGDESPIGQRVWLGTADSPARWIQIVGIVGNLNSGNPESPWFPAILLPFSQNRRSGMALMIRTAGDPLAAVGEVRQAIWAGDPDQPIADIRTMERLIDDALAAGETLFSIFLVFAVFALIMAAAGLYGVIAYAVSQRTQEIGIRMALGARGSEVVRLIGRQAVLLVGLGIGVGLLGAFLLGRVMASAFPGVDATDPLVMATVFAVFGLATATAIWLPARRAIRIDPVVALRTD